MKTKLSTIFLICILIAINAYPQSWIPAVNDDDILPPFEQDLRLCTRASDAFNNIWGRLAFDYYEPDAQMPVKTVLLNFNIFLDDNGINNYPNNQATFDFFDEVLFYLNIFYSDVHQLVANPIDAGYTPPYIANSKIQFELANSYFYNNSSLNTSTIIPVDNFMSSTHPDRLAEAINVFFTEVSMPFSGQATLPGYGFYANSIIHTYQSYSGGAGAWMLAQHLAHELGHSLDLLHTYESGGEACKTSYEDYMQDLLNAYVTPNCVPSGNCDVCYHDAGWSCDPTDPNNTCTNNLMGGGNHGRYYITPLQMGKMHRSLSIKSVSKYVKDDVYSTTPIEITQDQEWDFVLRVYNDIVVKSGNILTLKCHLIMPPQAKIIVEPNARLFIDGGTISNPINSNQFWQGIVVQGDWQENQMDKGVNGISLHQGEVVINGGAIKNALCAVEMAESTPKGIKGGGVLIADEAHFIDNIVGVKMNPYSNTFISGNRTLYLADRTKIENSEFKTTEAFLGTTDEIIHISLSWVNRVRIKGNTFKNENPAMARENIGTGIKSSNSSFSSVDQYFYLDPKSKNTFQHLLYGIENTGWYSNGTIKIQGNDFIDVYRNILLVNQFNAEILHNDIRVSDMDPNIPLASPWLASYGIYLEGNSEFTVEENEVYSYNDPTGIHGIIVNNSGALNNEIYKNNLWDLNVGVQPQYSNRGSSGLGLKIFCNEYNNPGYDNWVATEGGGPGMGIAYYQRETKIVGSGTEHFPAGNVFSPNANHPYVDPLYYDYDYSNKDAQFLLYYYWENATDKQLPYFHSNIGLISDLMENTCPSHTGQQIPDLYGDLGLAQVALNSSKLMLSIWENGGDAELDEEVETTQPWDVYVQFNDLMAESPYLSEDVIIAVINNEAFTSLMVKLLMVANPHVINNDEVMEALYERIPPMPQNYIDEILGEGGDISQLDLLRADVAADYHLVRQLGAGIKRAYRNDTINTYAVDSLISFVSRHKELPDRYELASIYLANEMYDDLSSCLEDIPSEFDLDDQQNEDHQDYLTLFSMADDIRQDGIGLDRLDGDQVNSLITIAEKNRPGISAFAVALLKDNDPDFEWYEIILEPDEEGKSGRNDNKEKLRSFVHDKDEFNIYPNPAMDFVTVSYSMKEKLAGPLMVIIHDSKGQVVIQRTLEGVKGETIIDLTRLSTGVYAVSLLADGKMISTRKLDLID